MNGEQNVIGGFGGAPADPAAAAAIANAVAEAIASAGAAFIPGMREGV